MKRLFLIAFLLFIFSSLLSAQNIQGTINIAAICSDGIIIMSDSRGAIVGRDNNILAYTDNVCKLTLLNGFPIAFSGSSLVGNTFATTLISDFNKNYNASNDIQKTLIDFRDYMIRHSADSLHQAFICVGYYNNNPYSFEFSSKSNSASDVGYLFNDSKLSPYLTPYTNRVYSCQELISILPNIIYRYARDSNQEKTIGGPISIVKVTKGNVVTWVQNDFRSEQADDYKSFLNLVEVGKIKLTPVVSHGDSLAIDAMKKRIGQ